MSDNGQKISIGVGLCPIIESVKYAKVGDTVILTLISGLTPSGVIWKSEDGQYIVETNDNSTVIFNNSGVYIPFVLSYPQYSYKITVTE